MTLRLEDLCDAQPEDLEGDPLSGYVRRCACGLPYDEGRGPHTKGGLVLRPDVVGRLLARAGEAYEVEERREADREAIRASRRLVIGRRA